MDDGTVVIHDEMDLGAHRIVQALDLDPTIEQGSGFDPCAKSSDTVASRDLAVETPGDLAVDERVADDLRCGAWGGVASRRVVDDDEPHRVRVARDEIGGIEPVPDTAAAAHERGMGVVADSAGVA
ncbi:MAG: hypothetical protein WCA57_12295 [Ilumatobacteraceae bacterium]